MPAKQPSTYTGRAAREQTRLVLETYGTVCHLCGLDGATTADHLTAQSDNGSHSLDNLRPAHRSCNSSRGNRPLPRHPITNNLGAFQWTES